VAGRPRRAPGGGAGAGSRRPVRRRRRRLRPQRHAAARRRGAPAPPPQARRRRRLQGGGGGPEQRVGDEVVEDDRLARGQRHGHGVEDVLHDDGCGLHEPDALQRPQPLHRGQWHGGRLERPPPHMDPDVLGRRKLAGVGEAPPPPQGQGSDAAAHEAGAGRDDPRAEEAERSVAVHLGLRARRERGQQLHGLPQEEAQRPLRAGAAGGGAR